MKKYLAILAVAALAFASCGAKPEATPAPEAPVVEETTTEAPATEATETTEAAATETTEAAATETTEAPATEAVAQ